MKKIYEAVAVLLIRAAVGLSAAASLPAEAGTLDALPAWDEPHVVVHVEDVSKTLARLGSSYLFDKLLDDNPVMTTYREQARNLPELLSALKPRRESFLDWVKNFPVESFSMAKGLTWENEDTFHGAVRFSPDKQEILSRLSKASMPADGDDSERASAEAKIKEAILDLLGVPSRHRNSFTPYFFESVV